jgi:glycosyltransferase involved in cell wall biosynthesis
MIKVSEIIIVNDGSPDNSEAIINKKALGDNRIIAIHKENGGVTSARNTGLAIAKGKYVFFLDGDDYIEVDALSKLFNIAEQNSADYVFGNFLIEYEDSLQNYKKVFPSFTVINNLAFLKYCFENTFFYITGCLINKEIMQKCRLDIPYDITFGEDNIAITQIAMNIEYAAYYNGTVLHYIQRKESVTNSANLNDMHQRARASMLTVDYAIKQGFYKPLKSEIDYFISKEQVGFITYGYWNDELSKYCTPSVLLRPKTCLKLGAKRVIILCGIFIFPTFTLKVYNFLRMIKRFR